MLVTLKEVLTKAQRGKYAVGAFNVYNIETLQAVIKAGEEMRSPVIVQTSEAALSYAGIELLAEMIIGAAKRTSIPVVLHLDHGKDLRILGRCLKLGYSSVMFDGSHLSYEENVALTKKVVGMSRKFDSSVEAELGTIGGKEDKVHGGIEFTKPDEAKEFVDKTGCDAFAVAIGTSHGAFKVQAHHLRLDILKEIRRRVKIPLVLHGASLVEPSLVARARKNGLTLEHTKGVRPGDIRKAIEFGITKVNVDTDLRLAFSTALREFAKKHPDDFNPRDVLRSAQQAAEESVKNHIALFGSKGKA